MIESTLLVIAGFKDAGGFEWRAGDRAPLHSRNVRQAALENPSWFACEYETEAVDLDWLREIDARYEAEYAEAKRRRDEQKDRDEQALRDELREQDRPEDRELERRYKKQEKERAEREKRAREERERRAIESELAFYGGSGFHR